MGEIDPAIRQIPEEIQDLIDVHKIPGMAFLSFYVSCHRYPSSEEFEGAMQKLFAKEVNYQDSHKIAA